MSEIFNALRKAQKKHDADGTAGEETRPAMQLPRAWLRENDAVPVLPDATEAEAPQPHSETPAPAERNGRGWLSRVRSRRSSQSPPSNNDALLMLQPGTLVAEQFRLLRTRIEMTGHETVMITSALDNEGKTLCAINLARTLAMSIGAGGVILIDADLRHPSVAGLLDIRTNPGIVDALTGDADWRQCMQVMPGERLRVIPAGTSSSIAPELLGSPRLATLIEEVKAEFPRHYVIFDAPPLLLTVDPLVLARHIDHALMVVRAGVTPRAAVMKAIESLGPERLHGIVFNGATAQLGHYYQYPGYYYGRPGNDGTP